MSGSKPVRIGLAGIGRAGWQMHCSELESRQDKFSFVAACDTIKARRDKMADTYGCRTYARVEDLVRDPDVELVDIATRSCDHFDHALLALKAGKDVFLEKPMCASYKDARRLIKAAERLRGNVYVRHNRRFEPAFQHISEIVRSGLLGRVFEIKLRRGGYQRRDDWQTLKQYGGGQLLNWGPHIIDHALRFLGESPVAVFSHLDRVTAVGDAEDYVRIAMRNSKGLLVDLEISGSRCVPEPDYVVNGSKGGLTCKGSAIQLRYLDPDCKLKRRRAKSKTPPEGGFGSADDLQWIEQSIQASPSTGWSMDNIWDLLYDAVRKGKTFPVRNEEALEVMRMVSLARKGTDFVLAGARPSSNRTSGRTARRRSA